MSTMLNIIINKVFDTVSDEYYYFDEPVEVKPTPHTPPVRIYAICVSPTKKLWVMDQNEQWHEVEANRESAMLIGSLYQRIQTIEQFNQKGAAA